MSLTAESVKAETLPTAWTSIFVLICAAAGRNCLTFGNTEQSGFPWKALEHGLLHSPGTVVLFGPSLPEALVQVTQPPPCQIQLPHVSVRGKRLGSGLLDHNALLP